MKVGNLTIETKLLSSSVSERRNQYSYKVWLGKKLLVECEVLDMPWTIKHPAIFILDSIINTKELLSQLDSQDKFEIDYILGGELE